MIEKEPDSYLGPAPLDSMGHETPLGIYLVYAASSIPSRNYRALVVVAHNEEEARHVSPNGGIETEDNWGDSCGNGCVDYEHIQLLEVTKVGIAIDQEAGTVILSEYDD